MNYKRSLTCNTPIAARLIVCLEALLTDDVLRHKVFALLAAEIFLLCVDQPTGAHRNCSQAFKPAHIAFSIIFAQHHDVTRQSVAAYVANVSDVSSGTVLLHHRSLGAVDRVCDRIHL